MGTSDARGCGANFHYDAAGRIRTEDYWPCLPEHADYRVVDQDICRPPADEERRVGLREGDPHRRERRQLFDHALDV